MKLDATIEIPNAGDAAMRRRNRRLGVAISLAVVLLVALCMAFIALRADARRSDAASSSPRSIPTFAQRLA